MKFKVKYFFSLFFLLVAVSSEPKAQTGMASAGQSAEQRFKNIQVLKAIPGDELIPAMQFITASLGVQCSYCHVENHFDQDDKKPKKIARKMMQMMAEINDQNFDKQREVTCNTCHRGAPRPVSIPVIAEGQKFLTAADTAEQQVLPAGVPSPDQLVGDYIRALGGEAAIKKVSSRVMQGSADFGGHQVAVDVFDKAPAQRAVVTHLPNGDNVVAFDGQEGWTSSPGRPPRRMPASELEGARIDADLQFPLHLKEQFSELRPGRPESIAGRETFQLIALSHGHPSARLYFDQQSHLLIRMLRYSDSPLGLNPVQIDFSDYRTVDGVQVPYRSTVARPGGQFAIEATGVKQNVPISNDKFTRPAGPQ
jgi:hypothetical protein